MKMGNLDKLLAELQLRARAAGVPRVHPIAQGIAAALESSRPMPKIVAFVATRDMARTLEQTVYTLEVLRFCEAFIFYYLLKGASAEHDIFNHIELDIILEILKRDD